MNDGTKKRRLLDLLEKAIAKGESHTHMEWARLAGCHPRFVDYVLRDAGTLARAARRYNASHQGVVSVTVKTLTDKKAKNPYTYLRLESSICRGAGFKGGETLLAKVEAGRVTIFRKPD